MRGQSGWRSNDQELAEALARRSGTRARLDPGEVVDERYRVTRPFGKGAIGLVAEVERLRDGHRFALKVLAGDQAPAVLARFAREAQIATRLDHPNLVRVVDVGVSPELGLFLVMELVEGSSLDRQRERYADRAWSRAVLAQVASGSVTSGIAADMWSFGALAHELLCGKLPFESPPLLDVLAGRPIHAPRLALPADLDPALASAIARCLSLDPGERPAAGELVAALA